MAKGEKKKKNRKEIWKEKKGKREREINEKRMEGHELLLATVHDN